MTNRTRTTGKALTAAVMIIPMIATAMWMTMTTGPVAATQDAKAQTDDLRAGKNFMPTKAYSEQEDQETLKLFEGLRVADVSDGMDKIGLANVGLMSPEIHAAWKDPTHYRHRFIGIAVTGRYVPSNRGPAPVME